MGVLYSYLFATGYMVFLYYSIMWIVKKTHKDVKRYNISLISFTGALLLTFFISAIFRWWNAFFIYFLPVLVVAFLFDYKAAKTAKCPACAEKINIDAKKCKHCHTMLENQNSFDEIINS